MIGRIHQRMPFTAASSVSFRSLCRFTEQRRSRSAELERCQASDASSM